jgi:hypothetical protein
VSLTSKQKPEEPGKQIVDHAKESTHRYDRHDDDDREVDGFFARGPDNLTEFRARFPKVLHHPVFFLNFSDHRQLLIRDRLRTNQDTVRLGKTVPFLALIPISTPRLHRATSRAAARNPYLVSRCSVCRRSWGQYFLISSRAVSFFLFFSLE